MKSTKAVYKSYRKLVSKLSFDRALVPNQNHGETVIPIGSNDLFVQLPSISDTFTFNIINTSTMTGAITLKTSNGASFKGLMLNTSGGSISIDPIRSTTDQITLENDVKDGSFIQTLSNGSEWFVWSVATGGTLSIRTGGINSTFTPTIVLPTPADITNVAITSDVRFVGSGLEARHDLTFSGEGEPGATLTIAEDGGAINPITIKIPSTGVWTITRATDLPNATYTFDFSPSAGNGVQNKSFIGDTGPITFTVPSAFSPDPAEVVDFSAGASAAKPDGTPLTVTVDSTAWNSGLAHGATFNIIYSITDAAVNGGVTVSQTVAGEIVDDTPPTAPVFLAASIANINELSANGTSEPGKTITLFQDSLALSPTVTSDGGGNWSFGPVALSFNSNFTLKAQATEDGVDNPNRSTFGEYSPAFNYVQPQVQKPTLTIDGEAKSTWSNTAGTFTLRGTTDAGSTISIKNGSGAATLAGGPSVVGTDWTATMTVANESTSNLTAVASLSNHLPNTSDPFGLLIDRVAPEITLTGGTQTVGLPNVGSNLDSGFSASDSSSGVATSTSNWDTQVSTTTEGTYTVTYNADDVAGNSATPVTRDVTVTTEVIVPVITSVTDNGNGTLRIQGEVNGAYSDNLHVQVKVDGNDDGQPVSVLSGEFEYTTTNLGSGTFAITAITVNSAGEESNSSSVENKSITTAPVVNPTITVRRDSDQSLINASDDVVAIIGSGFAFTASAEDYLQNDISSLITEVTNDVDTNTAGNYTVELSVTDSGGRTSTFDFSVEIQTPAFVEDIPAIITRVTNTANLSISNGVLIDTNSQGGGGLALNLDTDGLIAYDNATGETVNDEFTISFWAKLDNINANQYFIGTNSGRRLYLVTGGAKTNANIKFGWHNNDTGPFQHFKAGVGDFTNWTHFVIRFKQSSTHMVNAVFVNGAEVGLAGHRTATLGTKHMPPKNNATFKFGGTQGFGSNVASVEGEFDSIQFGDGIALTDDQILWIASDSGRQRTIDGALAAIDSIAPIITVTNTDTLADITGTPHVVNLTEGDTFNFSATTDDGSSVTQGGHTLDLNTAGTYNLTFDSTDAAGNTATQKTLEVVVAASSNLIQSDSLLVSETITAHGSATMSNGVLDLPGNVSDYGSIPGSSNYDATGDMTYSAWVYLDALPTQQAGIIGNLQPGNWSSGFSIQVVTGAANDADGGIRIACNNAFGNAGNNINDDFEVTNGISLNAWHFVAMTRDSSTNTARAYFNGVEIGSMNNATIGNSHTSLPIHIGVLKTSGSSSGNRTIDGQIQGVRIEQTLKSESLLLQIYNAGPQ